MCWVRRRNGLALHYQCSELVHRLAERSSEIYTSLCSHPNLDTCPCSDSVLHHPPTQLVELSHCVPMSHFFAHGKVFIKLRATYATVSVEVQPVNCAFLTVLAFATTDRATQTSSQSNFSRMHIVNSRCRWSACMWSSHTQCYSRFESS